MKKIILSFIFVLVFVSFVSAVQEPLTYYKLNLDYSYGEISIASTEIEFSNEEIENFFGLYTLEIIDYDGEILDLVFFDVPNEILWEGIDPETGEINTGGLLELNETSFELFVPYYENAKEIIIYDENLRELSKEDISEFSKQQPIDTEELAEQEIKQETTSAVKNIYNSLTEYWWVLLFVLFILSIILFHSITTKKK